MLHISELSDDKVENPEDIVNVGDELEVKILRVDTEKNARSDSRAVASEWSAEQEAAAAASEAPDVPPTTSPGTTALRDDLKGGLGGGGPLFGGSDSDAEDATPPTAFHR